MSIHEIDHIQLAMPAGREPEARQFYEGVLGIPEVPKPPQRAKRGAWFERGALKVHLGVEMDFRPARKAHPAFVVTHLRSFVAHLKANGVPVVDDEPLAGRERVYIFDPFGNRIELIEQIQPERSYPAGKHDALQTQIEEEHSAPAVTPRVQRVGPEAADVQCCSFCGKQEHETRALIRGPGVGICDVCAELALETLRQRGIPLC